MAQPSVEPDDPSDRHRLTMRFRVVSEAAPPSDRRGHQASITAYGVRWNAFGPVHCSLRNLSWYGPPAWRTEGPQWTYAYRLAPAGVLAGPAVLS